MKFVKGLSLGLAIVLIAGTAWGQYDGSGTFDKITSLDDLESGTYYVFYGTNASYTGAMTNTISGGRLGNTAVSPSGSSILNPSTAIVWYVVGNSVDGYTVYNEAADKYAEITTNSTSGYALNISSTHEYDVSFGAKGFIFQSNSATGGNRCISIYQTDWRPYLASGVYNLDLYKLAPPAVDPTIYLVPDALSGFSYTVGSGPSAEQSFTVSGENLEGDISITPPTNYEISTGTSGAFSPTNPITLSPDVEGDVAETTIYVRLKSGLGVNFYNGETITAASSGADSKTVTCNGRVMPVYDYVEQFDNFPETTTSYNSGTFTGIDGSTWNYVKCAGAAAQAIDAPTPVLGRNQTPVSELYSGTLPAGVKQLEFEYMQAFSNNANLEVYVNDVKVYTATSDGEQNVVKFSGIIDVNIDGNAVIKFLQPGDAGQVSIDNLRWSSMPEATSSVTINTGSNINQSFSGTNIGLDFTLVTTGATVTVNKYTTGPANVSFSGSAPTNVSSYRWVINAGDLAFTGGTIKIAVDGLGGISDPSSVDIYKRSNPGTGAFTKLTTSYSDGYLSASIDGFSEFILGSDDNSLPVTLSSFTAKAVKGTVVLEWETSAEIENQGFVISRQSTVGSPEIIASFATDDALKGQGTTTETTKYAYTDKSVEPGKTYVYTLADVDYAGNETVLETVEVKVEAEGSVVADGYALSPIYPNPFNATLTVPFTLTDPMAVSIELYSLTGQRMMTVVNRDFGAGSYNYTVQADDLASGIYFVRTVFGGKMHMQKTVLLK